MTTATEDVLVARNPATGAELGRVPVTPTGAVADAVARARAAQARWGRMAWPERRAFLRRWWTVLARDADAWADLIRAEVGKPRGEALGGDVVATLDAVRWTVKNAGRALADERLGAAWQRWLLLPPGRVRWKPFGVVGMVGTWNYPLLLNAPPIAQALAAGNAVVWKPSELATLSGLRLQQSLEAAGLPDGLVSAVFGGPEVGRALIDAALDKGVFTGGVENGRRVLEGLARRGVPALAELSGFDAAVVLPDAPLGPTARALAWGAFVGCGQTCVAVKRVLVVGDPAPWAEALAGQARALRVGDPASPAGDVGPMISEAARERFHRMVLAAVEAGARVLAGGAPLPGLGWFYAPTVLSADSAEAEAALAGAFGPVVLVRGFADPDAAVAAANASPYGLAASVWGRDLRATGDLARRLDAGAVAVNDAVTPTAHASAPFGGTKASGFGRTKGIFGLREFAQPQVLHARKPGGFRPQLFPYSALLERFLAVYRRLFHPHA
jgi:acyl-CoA reductase-like NAD-dependent aldehyde dehydrogenase